MKMKEMLVVGLTALVVLAGCTTYARITDPETGKIYYTRGFAPARSGYTGTLMFRDATTGADVNLDSSEVVYITKDEFNAAVRGAPTYANSWYFGR